MGRAKMDIPGPGCGQEHSPTKEEHLSVPDGTPSATQPQLFWTSQPLNELCLGLSGLPEVCGFPHHHPETAPKSSMDQSPTCSQRSLDFPKGKMGHLSDEALATPFCHLCLLLRPLTCHPFHTPWVNKAQGTTPKWNRRPELSLPLHKDLRKKTKEQMSPRKEPVGPCRFPHHHSHLETRLGRGGGGARGSSPCERLSSTGETSMPMYTEWLHNCVHCFSCVDEKKEPQ